MQSCQKCKIRIRGNKRCCPLCGGELVGEPGDAAFPIVRPRKVSSVSAFRIGLFVCILIEIVMCALSYLTDFKYGIFSVIMTIAPMYLFDFAVMTYFRSNPLKLITVEGYLLMGVCYLVDQWTGAKGWSIAWVIPITFVVLTIAIMIIGDITRNHLIEYVIYPATNILLSLLQIIPIVQGRNPFPPPAVICEGVMLIIAAYLLVFRSKELMSASTRYLNM